MKKKSPKIVFIICLFLMLCVWPFCLLRKDTLVSSNVGKEYLVTEQYLTANAPLTQSFIGQEAKLNSIEFALSYDEPLPEGEVTFDLYNADGKVVYSQGINFEQIDDMSFCLVEIDEWIHKGEEYTFCVSVAEDYDNLLRGVYSADSEPCTVGNQILRIGDEQISGYALTRYGYGIPLNMKNILCIWAFLVACGLCICRMFKQSAFLNKGNALTDTLWKYVDKYQIVLLLLELFGILALSAYICRVRVVDWDEAYSLQMITKYSFAEMFQVTAEDIHPPLYYIILRLFSMVFGTSVFALKMLSVLLNGCVMMLGITKVRKHWGMEAAFLFNLVVGLGPQFIFYSVNIRMYSLSLLFVMLCGILAYEILQGRGKWNWCFFVLSGLGGAYTHYFNIVPIAFIYGYLLVGLLIENRKKCKYFIMVCIATILGYLPWISVVLQSFKRAGIKESISQEMVDFADLFEWAFSTNIELSVYMPLVLYVISIFLLIAERKKYTRQEILFLIMCATNLLFSYVGCRLIASINVHFWDNRYIFASLGLFWLFIILVCCRNSKIIFCSLAVWLSITCASAYVIQMGNELGTNAYIDDTYDVLKQVRNEKVILYNYETFQVLYGAHLQEQEFIYIEDVEWENFNQDYIYMIGWGGRWFDEETIQKYQLNIENCGTMRFEEGVANVVLYKITFNAD